MDLTISLTKDNKLLLGIEELLSNFHKLKGIREQLLKMLMDLIKILKMSKMKLCLRSHFSMKKMMKLYSERKRSKGYLQFHH